MQIVIQRFADAQFAPEHGGKAQSGPGIILYATLSGAETDAVLNKAATKIASLRLWNGWTENVSQTAGRVIVTSSSGYSVDGLADAMGRAGFHPEVYKDGDHIEFINDGPCTMILDF
ncbi:D-aminoacyl-tRNA deacylase [Pancytospora philotis]|nr:D-aminoacyl-tRNA deacylase [Pancytospora philotis]